MYDVDYYKSLLEDFFTKDDYEFDGLNEFIYGLDRPELADELWRYLLDNSVLLVSDVKKECICISIFEVLAEAQVHPIWLKNLTKLLCDTSTLWIVIRAYKYYPEGIIKHLRKIARSESTIQPRPR